MNALAGPVGYVLAAVWSALAVVSAGSLVRARMRRIERADELRRRIRSWWSIVVPFSLALLTGPVGVAVLFAAASFVALREFHSLVPVPQRQRHALLWAYLAIPVQYGLVVTGRHELLAVFVPVYAMLLLPFRIVLRGETRGFLRTVGSLTWSLMLTVFGLSHAAALVTLPGDEAPLAGVGLLLYLVLLTELNDIAQYVWGRLGGGRRVLPAVSPGKTWAGLVGGVATTVALATLLAPCLTPLRGTEALAAGFLIGVLGFVGDVTVSAVKRDLGVKDFGELLPGHGGILDRLDSLLWTAPVFFYALRFMHY